MDPKYLFNENVKKMTPDNMQFNMSYILMATGFAGIIIASVAYFLLSNLRRSVPSDFQISPTIADSDRSHSRPNRSGQNRPSGIIISADSSDDGDTDDDDSDTSLERLAQERKSKKKIGVKKAAKLEAKAERRAAHEAMLREREERKREQEYEDSLRRAQEEKEKQEEAEREEKERLAREEQAKKEHEAYLELAANFEIQEEGHTEENETDGEDKLRQFIDYIRSQKVVLLEHLAAHFKMRTKDVIDRIQDLVANGSLVGIVDDRGKFISVTNDELLNVAKFIRQRGRVSIHDLYLNSNKLINLNPEVQDE